MAPFTMDSICEFLEEKIGIPLAISYSEVLMIYVINCYPKAYFTSIKK